MSTFDYIMSRQWTLKVPSVIRYIEEEFVEDFFATGRLMLSTYPRCVEHEIQSRRDSQEGRSSFKFYDGDHVVSGFQQVGKASYMLCTSMIEREGLMQRFGVDAFMHIHNVVAFADAVSRHVPGFLSGFLGACVYRAERSVVRIANGVLVDPGNFGLSWKGERMNQEELDASFNNLRRQQSQAISQELALDQFLLKENSFEEEAEFRIIWNVPYEVSGPLIVTCPEAIQFCSPYKPRAEDAPKPSPPAGVSEGAMLIGLSEEGARRRLGGDPQDGQ